MQMTEEVTSRVHISTYRDVDISQAQEVEGGDLSTCSVIGKQRGWETFYM
jgi:hypothetical protein